MSAWSLGDSKRLWHSLVKPVGLKYTEAEQTLDMNLTYINATDFEVGRDVFRGEEVCRAAGDARRVFACVWM